MPKKVIFTLLAVSLLWLSAEAGNISGKVDMGKKRPPPKMKKRYGGGADKLLKDPPPVGAVVYLEGDFSSEQMKPPAGMPEMKQIGLQFVPGVLPVMVGTTVSFPNLDPVYHNVFSYSQNQRFDLGRFQKGEKPPEVTFEDLGEVKVYCEIHSHMRSTIFVVKSPYFTVTDAEGNYKIEGVPAGEYTLKAWVNSRMQYEQSVTVSEDGDLEANLSGN